MKELVLVHNTPSRISGILLNPYRVSKPKFKESEISGETLTEVSTPYLGICLSETLEWEAHINKIISRANSTLGFLLRNPKACLLNPLDPGILVIPITATPL